MKTLDYIQNNNSTQVPTEECQNVDEFLEACKKKLPHLLGSYDSAQLSLSTTDGGTPLQPDDDIPAQNTAKNPLFIGIWYQRKSSNTT